MTATRMTIEEAQAKIAETISKAPEEKQEAIRIFMEGYAAGLEHILNNAKEAS